MYRPIADDSPVACFQAAKAADRLHGRPVLPVRIAGILGLVHVSLAEARPPLNGTKTGYANPTKCPN